MSKFLIIDVESMGLDPNEHSIASLGAVVWENSELKDEFEIFIAEDNIIYNPGAVEVNGISPEWLEKNGVHPSKAVIQFQNYVNRNFGLPSFNNLITLVGHNLQFDLRYLNRFLYHGMGGFYKTYYDKRFSRSPIDTLPAVKIVNVARGWNMDRFKLQDCLKQFDIPIDEEKAHSALYDAKKAGELFTRLVEHSKE